MAILIVSIPVPTSGDGPVTSIANLVGPKTVVLSGSFTGSYTLLASHDDVNFGPVAFFNADGPEGIEQTIDGSFKSLRVRANSVSTLSGPVTCEVSGIFEIGLNRFGTVASMVPGTSGLTPIVDTAALFPPSGVENGINFILAGSFQGALVVLGSLDGVEFNPIGTFRLDTPPTRVLVGTGPQALFAPLSTEDKTRYVRVEIAGQIFTNTTLTIGGALSAGAGPSGTALITLADDEAKVFLVPPGGVALEGILYEWEVDLDLLGVTFQAKFGAIVQALPATPTTATYNLYIGGTTPGDTTGATLVATFNTSSGTEVLVSVIGPVSANPDGTCLAQVTGVVTDPANQALIRGVNVTLG